MRRAHVRRHAFERAHRAGVQRRHGVRRDLLGPQRRRDPGPEAVGAVLVPDQPRGAGPGRRRSRLGDVGDEGLLHPVSPRVQRAEVPDEPALVLRGDVLAPHEQQVVPAEELTQLRLLRGAARSLDVEVRQLDSECLGHRHDSHQQPPITPCAECTTTFPRFFWPSVALEGLKDRRIACVVISRRGEREVFSEERVDPVWVGFLGRFQIAAAGVPVRDEPRVELRRATRDVVDRRTDPLGHCGERGAVQPRARGSRSRRA